MPSTGHLIILAVVIILIYGSSRLPDLARNIRLSMDELKKPNNNTATPKVEENKDSK